MSDPEDKKLVEFLRRSYFAVDGLWFVKVQEAHSWDEALRIDEKVWEILPKIQARKARELLGIEGGTLTDLAQGLALKFAAENHEREVVDHTSQILRIHILACPWLELLRKSGKLATASEICDRICARDFEVWASEFSDGIRFSLESKLADGAPVCEFLFTLSTDEIPTREAAG